MTTLDAIEVRPEPKRDRFGRYLIVPRGGGKAQAYTRATTIAETLDDRYNLELWKMRQVALGLAQRPDLLAQAAAHTAEDKKTLNDVCKQAMDAAAAMSGANMGTALHKIIERHTTGTLGDCPEMFADRLDAFRSATEGLTFRRDLVERVAVLDRHLIAGTFDMAVEIDGRLYVADFKTGSGVDFGARGFAVQLAIYANASSLYDYATEQHSDAPGFDLDRAIVIHLPAEGGPCELHWLDIAAGAEALEHAMWTRAWRKRRDLLTSFDHQALLDQITSAGAAAVEAQRNLTAAMREAEAMDLAPADPELRAWIAGRITALPDAARNALAAAWPDVPTLKASDAHTEEQLDLIAAALDVVERDHAVPFGPDDPRKVAQRAAELAASPLLAERPARPEPPAPFDEGPDIDGGLVGTLRATIEMLPVEQRSLLESWAGEANDAGRSISLRSRRSAWRYAVVCAAVDLVTTIDDLDVARTILGLALGDEVQPATTTGAALAALSIDAAAIVQRICAAVADGSLTVDGDAVVGAALASCLAA